MTDSAHQPVNRSSQPAGGSIQLPASELERCGGKPSLDQVQQAHSIAQQRVDEQQLGRDVLSSEVASVLNGWGFDIGSTPTRNIVNEINSTREQEGRLRICTNPDFISLELAVRTFRECTERLTREPTKDEHAESIGSVLGKSVQSKSARRKILEYNRQQEDPKEKLEHSPVHFSCGYYPGDVYRVYQKYLQEHRKERQPHLRKPTYEILAQMVVGELPEAKATAVNIVSHVSWLRRHGKTVNLRGGKSGGTNKLTKRMLGRAIDLERVRCEVGESEVTTGGVAARLKELYPKVEISTDSVSSALKKLATSGPAKQRERFQHTRKHEKLDSATLTAVYEEAIASDTGLVPFPPGAVLSEATGYHESAVRSAIRKLNPARARQGLCPYLPAQNTTARDLNLLVSFHLGVLAMQGKLGVSQELLSIAQNRKPHRILLLLRQMQQRAAQDGIAPLAFEEDGKTRLEGLDDVFRRVRTYLVWALTRATLKPSQMGEVHALATDLRSTLQSAAHPGLFRGECAAVAMAATEGRFSSQQVEGLQERLSTISSDARGEAYRSFDECLKLILQPANLLFPEAPANATAAALVRQLEDPEISLQQALESQEITLHDFRRIAFLRSFLTPDKKKLEFVDRIAAKASGAETGTETGEADIAVRFVLDPLQVARWKERRSIIAVHTRVSDQKSTLDTAKQFLDQLSGDEQRALLAEIQVELKEGRVLSEVLGERAIPELAYSRMVHFRRTLSFRPNECLALLDLIKREERAGTATKPEVLEREQVNPEVVKNWERQRGELEEKVKNPVHDTVLAAFRKSYALEDRRELLAEIREELDAGEQLRQILARRWIPRYVYDDFLKSVAQRYSASEKLALLDQGRAVNGRRGDLVKLQIPQGLFRQWKASEPDLKRAAANQASAPENPMAQTAISETAAQLPTESLDARRLRQVDAMRANPAAWVAQLSRFVQAALSTGRGMRAALDEHVDLIPPRVAKATIQSVAAGLVERSGGVAEAIWQGDVDMLRAVFGDRMSTPASASRKQLMFLRGSLEMPLDHPGDIRRDDDSWRRAGLGLSEPSEDTP